MSWTQNHLTSVPIKLTWATNNYPSGGTELDGDHEVDSLLLKLFSSSIIRFSSPLCNEDQILSRILVCSKERERSWAHIILQKTIPAISEWTWQLSPAIIWTRNHRIFGDGLCQGGFSKGSCCGGIQSPGSRDRWFSLSTPAHSMKSQYFPKIPTCYHEKEQTITVFRKMLIFYLELLEANLPCQNEKPLEHFLH